MTQNPETLKPQIFVCTNLRLSGASCAGRGGFDVLKALRQHPRAADGTIAVRDSVCMGYCSEGPNAKIIGGEFHHGLKAEDAERLVRQALGQSAEEDASKA